jgi:hypothetical protein
MIIEYVDVGRRSDHEVYGTITYWKVPGVGVVYGALCVGIRKTHNNLRVLAKGAQHFFTQCSIRGVQKPDESVRQEIAFVVGREMLTDELGKRDIERPIMMLLLIKEQWKRGSKHSMQDLANRFDDLSTSFWMERDKHDGFCHRESSRVNLRTERRKPLPRRFHQGGADTSKWVEDRCVARTVLGQKEFDQAWRELTAPGEWVCACASLEIETVLRY